MCVRLPGLAGSWWRWLVMTNEFDASSDNNTDDHEPLSALAARVRKIRLFAIVFSVLVCYIQSYVCVSDRAAGV